MFTLYECDYAALAEKARGIVATWPEDWQVAFDELAASKEESGQPRAVAEFEAFWFYRRQF